MPSSDEILQQAAHDGSIDIAEWPRVLEDLLQKLRDIVHNDFPVPSVPLPAPLPSSIDPEVVNSTPPLLPAATQSTDPDILPDAELDGHELPSGSQSSTKENDAPVDGMHSEGIAEPTFAVNQALPDGRLDNVVDSPLPPELFNLYTGSTRTLERDFAESPPYTIQRLAELVLYPRKHYRFLPAYLRALDRIVSVSSPVSDFPLPSLHTSLHGAGFLTNGDSNQSHGLSERDGLGSDESLGGALLTPIPWLHNNALISPSLAAATTTNGANTHDAGELHSESTTTIDGPNGAGSIETVSVIVNGVPSVSSIAHSSPSPTSPTLSEQSDASSSGSSAGGGGGAMTDAQLREQGGVTQGELLRMEQEAGIVPATQQTPRRTLLGNGAAAVGREPHAGSALGTNALGSAPSGADALMADEPGAPHARGPDEIGMEDMGPQPTGPSGEAGMLDIEAAMGRRSLSPQPPSSTAAYGAQEGEEGGDETGGLGSPGRPGRDPADVEKDVVRLRAAMDAEREAEALDDVDMVLADADGRPIVAGGQRTEPEITGDLGGAEAADTTTL